MHTQTNPRRMSQQLKAQVTETKALTVAHEDTIILKREFPVRKCHRTPNSFALGTPQDVSNLVSINELLLNRVSCTL